jgi:tetratricopeptide (TPR) repeat protein/tRNA A37 threonylcarbamoyladenosine biosynthesis protein TsaE
VGAVADRLLVDLAEDGRVSVGTWLDGQYPETGNPCELAWPLDDDALEDLRWYLEDYLRAPFGVYGERGPMVEAALTGWGRAVFSAVFGGGPARDAYLSVRARGPAEMAFRSASPQLLGLPWELMADPAISTPLAVDLAGVSRSFPVAEPAQTVPVPAGRLRVLMVISRPAGTGDVGYRMIARPLLERLEAVRGQVDLVVLRPSTLDALKQALAAAAAAKEPFQVVHFDGHGILAGRRAAGAGAPLAFAGPGLEGVLVFEKPNGGADDVPASRLAQVLVGAGVPVVVLNACQSGAVGKDLESAVATRLLRGGVASVVAMAYTVYAVAAAEFMAAFYERLFAGETVTAAVTMGRQRMYQRNLRPSPKGELPLADWLVPVHYLRRDISFPQLRTERSASLPPLDQILDKQRAEGSAAGAGTEDLDAVGSFIGRDDLFFQLEVAARLQKVVVLHGPGGTGKTELAKAFGRWWRDTGGVEDADWVFWHSFEPGVGSFGLDGVITEIGLRLYGADFARLGTDRRRAEMRDILTGHRMLLIWDNFESVWSMPDPDGATRPLDEAGRTELREFLGHLAAHGRSAVLITSRSPEAWLGAVRTITVGGLAKHEAVEYADNLLAPYPAAAPRRSRHAFGELMEWLDGNPLSMRLMLPRLDAADPETLLAGLQGMAPLPAADDPGAGRTTSLSASIGYSFAHLAEPTRRLLPAVSLFHTVADADVLATFSQVPDVPERFRSATKRDWLAALDDATRVGLLTRLGNGMYRIHPALPGYLAHWWDREEPDDYEAVREAATKALLIAQALIGDWLNEQISSGSAELAFMVIRLQRRTMESLLGYGLDHGLWDKARAIAQPLDGYWKARGLDEEASTWTDRVRRAVEDPDGTPPQLDTSAGTLWLFFVSNQAWRERERGRLDDAERIDQQILTMLEPQHPSGHQQRNLAVTYHELGRVAHDRGRLDEAEQWYRRSLAIEEQCDDTPAMAATYHQLGMVAEARGLLEDAVKWYRKSLAIEQERRNQPGIATSYNQLSIIAADRGQLVEADDLARMALAIRERIGDRPGIADSDLQLGNIAYHDRRLDDAEEWYRRSLAIREQLADRPGIATLYFQLGNLAQAQRRPQDAEDWYRISLAIRKELGDRPGMADVFNSLGVLACEQQRRLEEAEDWYRKSLAIREEFRDEPGQAMVYHNLAVVACYGGRLAEAEAWYRTSIAIRRKLEDWRGMAADYELLGLINERTRPRAALEWAVRCTALSSELRLPVTEEAAGLLVRLTARLGTGDLEQCWRQVTGGPLPEAVRRDAEGNPP